MDRVVNYLDLSLLGLDDRSLVEIRDHAEAASAVLDDGADCPPPLALRVLRRVLVRHLEVPLQEALHPIHRPSPPLLPPLSSASSEEALPLLFIVPV